MSGPKDSDDEHGDDAYFYYVKGRKPKNGDMSNVIKIARRPKMTDVHDVTAVDAQHDHLRDEFLEWLAAACRREGVSPALARLFNLGSPPEEKKVTKKREYKPKVEAPKIESLKKVAIKFKSKLKETKEELQAERSKKRLKTLLDNTEKYKNMLEKAVEFMDKKNIEIYKNVIERMATISREIDKIKNNITKINENVASKKVSIDRATKKWKKKESQVKTDSRKIIQEMENTLIAIKQRTEAKEQHEAEEKDRINREIQNVKDAAAKKEHNIQNNIEAWEISLVMIKEQCEKNIRNKNEEGAETIARIDAEIKKLEDDELKKRKKIDSIIAAKRTEVTEMEKKHKEMMRTKREKITHLDRKIKKFKDAQAVEKRQMEKEYEERLKIANAESEKKIRAMDLHEAEIKIAINAQISHWEDKEAQHKVYMVEQQNILEKYTKKNRVIEELRAEIQSKIEADIETLKEKADKAKIDLDKNIKAWQNLLAIETDQVENNIEEMQREGATVKYEIKNNFIIPELE